MQDFIVDNVKCGVLRGSTIQAHDVIPFLEGKSSITTSAGTFNNTVFYDGSEFTTAPDFDEHYNWLKCVMNTGAIHYIPLYNVVHTYTLSSDGEHKVRSASGFNRSLVNPYYTHTLGVNLLAYDSEKLGIVLNILKHSSLYLLSGSLANPALLSCTSFPSVDNLYELVGVSLSMSMSNEVVSDTYSIAVPCYSLENYGVDVKTYSTGVIERSYAVESYKVLKFTKTYEAYVSFTNDVLHYLFSVDDELYTLDGSVSFVIDMPDVQEVNFVLRSVSSVVSNIVH